MSQALPSQQLLSPRAKGLLWALVALGVVALIAGLVSNAQGVYGGILDGFVFIIDLGLGGAMIIAINAACGARWDTVFRQVPQAVAATLFWTALLVLVFAWAVPHIYPWAQAGFYTNPENLDNGTLIPELAAKRMWLNPGWFSFRAVLYVVLWTGLMGIILRLYRAQERDGISRTVPIRRLAIFFCFVFAYSFCLSSFDWLMSTEPLFYSAMFGVYCFAGVMQVGFAVVLLLVLYLDAKGVFKDQIREQHKHDLGKWLFAFSCFWAYTWFFQFMLTWYADLPDESRYYVHREGMKAYVMTLIVIGRFCVPFFGLASQKVKKNPKILAAVALIVIASHWLDIVLMTLVSQPGGLHNLFALILPLAAGAGFVLLFFRAFAKQPALPRQDAAYAYSRRYLT